ncbi:MAG: Gfo/Idh/MocA family protein [Gemmataceae bacterium]
MAQRILRVGLIGAGANTRLRHLPGLQVLAGVEIAAVCNRRPASTVAVAREFNIPHTYERWEDLIADPDIHAVVVGAWPCLHYPITLAALKAGKHVLTEARMSLNAREAHEMLAASRRHPRLVCQIVPSPYGLKGDVVMRELIREGFLGELREVHVYSRTDALADSAAPLSWRQDAALSGVNMLTLGIVHETLLRWTPPPLRVLAQAHAFTAERIDPESGVRRPVGTPDSVQVLSVLSNGARASYHVSGVTPFGAGSAIQLYGTDGVLYYDLLNDRISGVSRAHGAAPAPAESPREIPIPKDKERGWQVEADFVDSIRLGTPVQLSNFETGVAYMEFTEAVAHSARTGMAVKLPLSEEE